MFHWHSSFVVAFLMLSSCEGELPEYADPGKLFSSSAAFSYRLTTQQNDLVINVTVKNIYDETLDGIAEMKGSVAIILSRLPEHRRTFDLTAAQLISAKSYNRTTRRLTIDPEDEIVFQVIWDFVDDNGVNLPQDVFRLAPDASCFDPPPNPIRSRRITQEVFTVTGSISIFPRVTAVSVATLTFTLCYANSFYASNLCAPVQCN